MESEVEKLNNIVILKTEEVENFRGRNVQNELGLQNLRLSSDEKKETIEDLYK